MQRLFLGFRHFRAKVRNDHVVAGESAVRCDDLVRLAAANVGDFDLSCALRIADVVSAYSSAV